MSIFDTIHAQYTLNGIEEKDKSVIIMTLFSYDFVEATAFSTLFLGTVA